MPYWAVARTHPGHDRLAQQSLVELSLAGAPAEQIAAVLGHASVRQTEIYIRQAEQRVLARGAQRKRDEMYERERREAAIDGADNVARLESPSEAGANGARKRL